ncbi:MAG: 2,3-bisphosphoglycerate-independent phosphoglycerate mutase [Lachnospiraceae bacterium]|nr:2,3-bisphosphoglycerate-independent phosphoglycerate mutase [Lachnospiraceae bacterium]
MSKKPVVLLILDGYGLNEKTEGNAVAQAKTPVMDRLMKEYPFVKGNASGMAVGLPDGQMGNSEVGHLNMGAGRIVYQELTRITKEIQDGTFFENEELMRAVNNCKENDSSLHLYGLLSDGGVHSHNTHLYGLLELAKRNGLSKVYIHCFLDGRDTPPQSAADFAQQLEDEIKKIGVGKIASVSGRYYAMDRDNNYDRVEKAYDMLTKGIGNTAASAVEGIKASYAEGVNDEFVVPFVVQENGQAVATIKDKDSVIFFNFRPDRAREITHCFCDDDFDKFDRGPRKDIVYVCFTEYDPLIPNKTVAFKKVEVTNTFGEYLAKNGKKQARIAETEKYAHVTFFFNGGIEEPNENEDRILVNSPKYVPTYDKKPRMSAYTVTDKLSEAIAAKNEDGSPVYDVIICNLANPDMVGHTGVLEAAVEAIEVIDKCVGEIESLVLEHEGALFICADHGNAEQLIDYETGAPFTAHTTNPVPFILIGYPGVTLREGGCLADIVPTLLEVMGMPQPAEMTGKSLIVK